MFDGFFLKIVSLTKLKARQWWWFLRAWSMLWPVHWQLRFNHASWVARELGGDASAVPELDCVVKEYMVMALEMHESVRLAERCHPLRSVCLPKALVLKKMLRARGVPAVLRIGVSKRDELFASHAWVEVDGIAVAEPDSVKDDFSIVDHPIDQLR